MNFKAWKHFLKEAEAREEDKPWYRGQSGPWGRSAGRVSQLQGENGGRGRNGEEVGKSSIPNTKYQILKRGSILLGTLAKCIFFFVEIFSCLSFYHLEDVGVPALIHLDIITNSIRDG